MTFDLFINTQHNSLLIFLASIVGTVFIGGMVHLLTYRVLSAHFSNPLTRGVSLGISAVVYGIGLVIAYSNLGALSQTASLVAIVFLGSAALLPTIPLIANLVAGFVLLVERDIRTDDTVDYEGQLCTVSEVSLRRMCLTSEKGERIIVPHLMFLTQKAITKYEKHDFVRVTIPIQAGLKVDFKRLEKEALKICKNHPLILPHIPKAKKESLIKEYHVNPKKLEDSHYMKQFMPVVHTTTVKKETVTITLQCWTWDVKQRKDIQSYLYEAMIPHLIPE